VAERGVKDAAALGFEQNAAAYERSRPSYPAAAISCIVGRARMGPGRRVVDVAAGTGKLTRLLVPSGAEVVAVEPVAAMRTELARAVPNIEIVDGTAEALPLPDQSVAAITVAQAFHWFDPQVALREMRRVLEPDGCLVLTWNTRDRAHDWVRQFGELLVDGDLERPYDMYYEVDYAQVVADAGGYTPVETFEVAWEQPFDVELLVARAASVSVVGTLPDDEREAVLARVRNLAATHPDLAGRETFGFPYTTRVFWCHRR
jgi:ubiquinone/menaquinone biosynthesis C-methylase UbiE